MSADPARAKSVFLAASDLADPAERAAYLDRACGDPELRARVEALLRADAPPGAPATGTFGPGAHGSTGTFAPGAPAGAHGTTSDYHDRTEHVGSVVGGRYALLEPIGEGGMGSVWRAKQTDPVKRFVAVKLIKAGMDSKQVLARFEAERQALALMDHPNIATVLDGGLHESRPFFVMELVKGTPITRYCDAHRLTPHQRLGLFAQACQAIQHAHQKGIIHRDIKPNNVLVALYDDKPVVKVIDFGVAKATGAALTEATIDTGFGAVVGTPEYMSPEQATFNNLDIDTRSDVYALGVLLYELLTGSPPFSGKELHKKGLLEMLRVVREEEPPRPSTKLSTADALPTLSAARGTEPKKLTGLLRNELDWIVMKALEKDRARRYESATGFAADVQRYLAGEAVHAHPPSAGYRFKKFVRRNRPQVLATALVLFALLAGIVGTTLGLLRAEAKRRDAVQAQENEAAQRTRAEQNELRATDEAAKATRAGETARASDARARAALENTDKLLAIQRRYRPRGGDKYTPADRATLDGIADEYRAISEAGTGPASAEACGRLAVVLDLVERADDRAKALERAVLLWVDLARTDPDGRRGHLAQVARARRQLANVYEFRHPIDPKFLVLLRQTADDWKAATEADPANADAFGQRAAVLQELAGWLPATVSYPPELPPALAAEQADLRRQATESLATAAGLRLPDPALTAQYVRSFGGDSSARAVRETLRAAVRFPDHVLPPRFAVPYDVLCRNEESFDSLLFDRIAGAQWRPRSGDVIEEKNGELVMADRLSPEELVRRKIADPCREALKEFPNYKYAGGLELLLKVQAMRAVENDAVGRSGWKGEGRQPDLTGAAAKRRDELFAEALALARKPETRLPAPFVLYHARSKLDRTIPQAVPLSNEEYVWWSRLSGNFGTLGDATVSELKRELARRPEWKPTPMFCLRAMSAASPGSEEAFAALSKEQLVARWELTEHLFTQYEAGTAGAPKQENLFWDWQFVFAGWCEKRFRDLGDRARVRAALTRLLSAKRAGDPARAGLLQRRGDAALDSGDWDAALADYRECAQVAPPAALKYDQQLRHVLAVARFRAGVCLLRLDRFADAEPEFDAAVDLRRGEPNRLPNLRTGKPAVPWNVPVTERDRANEYAQVGRWDAARAWAQRALKTLDENGEAYAPVGVKELRVTALLVAARAGDHADAARQLSALAAADKPSADDLYNCACGFAVCAAGRGVEKADAEKYRARAVELLRKAVAAGYKDVAHMEKDSDLDALRGHADFTALLAELKKP